jgi:SAM-dependent methyltransferase
MSNKQIVLEIGCGEKKEFPNSIALDVRKTNAITLLGDAKKLPFKNESVDYIYSSHTIEHFSHREVEQVLREWTRVLKEEGGIEIRCPDLRARALFFSLHPSKRDIINIYGGQDYPENLHRCGFSENLDCRGYPQAGDPLCQNLTTSRPRCQSCRTSAQTVSASQKNRSATSWIKDTMLKPCIARSGRR